MIICTVATHADRYYPSLVDSCQKLGYELKVLGWGQQWKGFAWKFLLMREFLAGLADQDQVVMFVDAFDVIALKTAAHTEATFRAMNVPVLFGVEKSHPNMFVRAAYSKLFKKCRKQNLNTGMLMGYARHLLEFYEESCKGLTMNDAGLNDQQLACDYCQLHHEKMHLDIEGRIFMNIFGGKTFKPSTQIDLKKNRYFTIRDGVIVNKDTGHEPCMLHGPGDTNLDEIVDMLGYTPGNGQNVGGYYWQAIKVYTPLLLWTIIGVVLLILLVIAVVIMIRRMNPGSLPMIDAAPLPVIVEAQV